MKTQRSSSIIEAEIFDISPMTPETEKRLLELIENPPPGSAIAEAKEFGVDLYTLLENLKLAPAERFRRAAEETDLVRYIRTQSGESGS